LILNKTASPANNDQLKAREAVIFADPFTE